MPQAQIEPGPAWALVEQLAAGDAGVRISAVAHLRRLGHAAAPALERGLEWHPRADVRRWCAHLLVGCGRRASACAIVSATHDRVSAVRLLALRALTEPRRRGDEFLLDTVPHIVRLARHDRSKRVRRAALEMLAQRLHDGRAEAAVRQAAADPRTDPGVRRMCLDALDEDIGRPEGSRAALSSGVLLPKATVHAS